MNFTFSKTSQFCLDFDKNNGDDSNEATHSSNYSETDNDDHCDEDNSNDFVNYENKDNQDDDTGKVKDLPRTVDECFNLINRSPLVQTVVNNMIKKRVILPSILHNLMSEQLFKVKKGNFENHKIPSAQDVATHVYDRIIVPYAAVNKNRGDFIIQITLRDYRNVSSRLTTKNFVKRMMGFTNQKFLTKLIAFSNERERQLQVDEERIISSSMSGSESSSFLYPPEKMKDKKLTKKQDRDKKLEDFLVKLSQNTVAMGGREAKDVANLYNYKMKSDAYVQQVAEKLKVIMKKSS